MKKKKIALVVALASVMATVGLAGCSSSEFSFYQGETKDDNTGRMEFSTDLFYRNDIKMRGNADPFVLDNTARDGYYYMFATFGYFMCHRSKDLVNWDAMGVSLDTWNSDNDAFSITYSALWAPEVVYDPDTELYYMHFSATPQDDNSGATIMLLMCAVSDTPYGPYSIVNFKDPSSCGEENVHDYDETEYYETVAPYLMLDPEIYHDFSTSQTGKSRKYPGAIDPHAFIDDDGTKYLYFVDNVDLNFLTVVEMENWLKPKWETMTLLTAARFWTIDDFRGWKETGKHPADGYVSYESNNNSINEGPTMTKHNGKYYLTYSVNDYAKSEYAVCQAVADRPTGPFRKLREEENGLLLSSLAAGSKEVSGSGHHSFVTVDDNMYIIYHRHDDYVTAGAARNPGIDELKWVTIKDKDGKDLDVMYVNGPTWNIQPLPEGIGKYKNIAPQATVTGGVGGNAEYLTDELLSVCKTDTDFQYNYIIETDIEETTTFTFDFSAARTIRAVMIYESKYEDSVFMTATVELVTPSGKTYKLDLSLAPELYEEDDYYHEVDYISPGASIFAEFAETEVTSVRITVPVRDGQDMASISEIRILGLAEGK